MLESANYFKPIRKLLIEMSQPDLEPLTGYTSVTPEEMVRRAEEYYQSVRKRRTVRDFSYQPVPLEVVEKCVLAAGTAPNGANLQPWHFAIVSSPEIKNQIRLAAEEEEREFYAHRAPPEWLEALAPLGTDDQKPFLETAPHLIVVFAQSYSVGPQGKKTKNYYVAESVGIATGFLINALHQAGLATLTHTPAPMKFLNEILKRPDNERPYLILVTGFPAADAEVPKITKKSLNELVTYH